MSKILSEVEEEYRVAHLLRERDMLTSDSKFRWWPGLEGKLTAKRNFKFGVSIILSQSRWATLYYQKFKVVLNHRVYVSLTNILPKSNSWLCPA